MHAHGILNALTLALTDQSDPVPKGIHSFHPSLINNQPAIGGFWCRSFITHNEYTL